MASTSARTRNDIATFVAPSAFIKPISVYRSITFMETRLEIASAEQATLNTVKSNMSNLTLPRIAPSDSENCNSGFAFTFPSASSIW